MFKSFCFSTPSSFVAFVFRLHRISSLFTFLSFAFYLFRVWPLSPFISYTFVFRYFYLLSLDIRHHHRHSSFVIFHSSFIIRHSSFIAPRSLSWSMIQKTCRKEIKNSINLTKYVANIVIFSKHGLVHNRLHY